MTTNYCTAVEDQLTGQGQVVPLSFFRSGIAARLANRSIGEQLAAQYDVEPGRTYDKQVAALEQSAAALGEDVRDAVVLVETEQTYTQAIQAAVGRQLLDEEGAGDVKYSETVARGQDAYQDWIADNGVTFDPKLGVDLRRRPGAAGRHAPSPSPWARAPSPAASRTRTRSTPRASPTPSAAADPRGGSWRRNAM